MSLDSTWTPEVWVRRDIVVVGLVQAAGAVLLLLSWLGVSGTTSTSRQLEWLNLGGVGLVVAGTGVSGWLYVGRRRIGRRRKLMLQDQQEARLVDAPGSTAVAALVAARGMRHFHRTDCQLVGHKAIMTESRSGHEQAGRVPCGVCRP